MCFGSWEQEVARVSTAKRCFVVSSHASHIDDEKRRCCDVGLVRRWRRCSVHAASPVSELSSKNKAIYAVAFPWFCEKLQLLRKRFACLFVCPLHFSWEYQSRMSWYHQRLYSAARENNDNDNDRSCSQLHVHKGLACPQGQSTRALTPSLSGQALASCKNKWCGRRSCAGSCHLA